MRASISPRRTTAKAASWPFISGSLTGKSWSWFDGSVTLDQVLSSEESSPLVCKVVRCRRARCHRNPNGVDIILFFQLRQNQPDALRMQSQETGEVVQRDFRIGSRKPSKNLYLNFAKLTIPSVPEYFSRSPQQRFSFSGLQFFSIVIVERNYVRPVWTKETSQAMCSLTRPRSQGDVLVRRTVRRMEPREIKGLEIAAKTKLTRKGKSNIWLVPSQSGLADKYSVALDSDKPSCTCRDHEFTNDRCKHIFAVEYTVQREQTPDGQTVITETVKVTRKTYTQNWPAYNAAQTTEKSHLQALLYELCRAIPEPLQQRGRPRLSLADIIFASTFKVYSTVSGRRFQSDLQEARRRGFLSKMPSYNSVFRYLESEALTPYLYDLIATSALPLKSIETDFAVDSSGFSTGQFMRWLDVKYGKEEDRRMWIKVHLMCGVKTNIVTSVEISEAIQTTTVTSNRFWKRPLATVST